MTTKRRVLVGAGSVLALGLGILIVGASILKTRAEPFVRERTIRYLSERFDADVRLEAVHVSLPSLFGSLKSGSVVAEVTFEDIVLQRKGFPNEPPIFTLRNVACSVDVLQSMGARKRIPYATIQGMQINVPPKGDRPKLMGDDASSNGKSTSSRDVAIDSLFVTDTVLILLPKDPKKIPLDFQIHQLEMKIPSLNEPMQYTASLRNPKPAGQIESTGTFGPWNKEDPGSSPLQGGYTFSDADLGVFKGIAGILQSTGAFAGELSRIQAHGEADVADFRLKNANHPVPLKTQFEAEVDGTNGNTTLKPVHAQLGKSKFVTSGAIIKHDADPRRTIDLNVKMAAGRVEDFLRLAMKGSTLMEGKLALDAMIRIPPLQGKVVEKLELKGKFDITDAKFLKSTIQDRIDSLSRKGQGQPNNEGIDEVVSKMSGAFVMEDQTIDFSRLQFGTEGAEVLLAGKYDLDEEIIDFHGSLRLAAKVSQTQSGAKRWLLKPLDPFFAKNGVGTDLPIKIGGTRSKPSFGLELRRKQDVAKNQTSK